MASRELRFFFADVTACDAPRAGPSSKINENTDPISKHVKTKVAAQSSPIEKFIEISHTGKNDGRLLEATRGTHGSSQTVLADARDSSKPMSNSADDSSLHKVS